MRDLPVVAALVDQGVSFALIGAHACAVWGYARYTADIDFLTVDERVLDKPFWPAEALARLRSLRRGDDDDPLRGVVRFSEPDIDLVVGRGRIAREAIATASLDPILGVPVASPLSLALLKLEAGSLKDSADVFGLIEALRLTTGEDLAAAIQAHRSALSSWGLRAWDRVEQALTEASPRE